MRTLYTVKLFRDVCAANCPPWSALVKELVVEALDREHATRLAVEYTHHLGLPVAHAEVVSIQHSKG